MTKNISFKVSSKLPSIRRTISATLLAKVSLIFAIFFIPVIKVSAQIPIQYYDFESNSLRNSTAELTVEQVINSGTYTITSAGLSNPTGVAGAGLSGTTTPGRSGSGMANGMAYQWDTWATTSTEPAANSTSSYILFTANTSGFTGIAFQFDYNNIGTSNCPYLGVSYSVDGGTNWTSATTPSYFYSGSAIWRTASVSLPSSCNNLSNLKIRIYGWWGGSAPADKIAFDNILVTATGTSAGKVFTSLDESAINTSFNSGSTGSIYTRTNFTVTGASTNMTIHPNGLKISGAFAITTSGTVTFNTGATPSVLTGTGTFNVGSTGTLVITSPNGITSSGASGNVQSTGTRTFDAGANYTYQGGAAQVTGNGLPASLTGNLTINNSSGVTLSRATSTGGAVALSSGLLTTSSTNLLTVTNTATTAFSRTASASSNYIDGPVKWSLSSTGSNYVFPVGNTSTYLPYTIILSASSSPVITLQAYKADVAAAATYDATLSNISHTEYWLATLNSGTFTGAVSLTRDATVTAGSVIAKSSAQSGTYTNIGGTVSSPSINTSNSVSSLGYFCIAEGRKNFNISSYNSFVGAGTYCKNDASPTPLTATFNTCNSGTGTNTATTVTVTWYYNTTNTTAISGATTMVQQRTGVSTGTGATDSFRYTPSTAAWGSYYYFCVVSSPSNTYCGITSSLSTTGTQLVTVQNSTLTLASNTAVSAANICAASVKVPIESFNITPSTCSGSTLTGLSFTTATGHTASDITNFKLWYGTTNSLGSATQLGSSLTTSLGSGIHSFSFTSPTLTSGTTYYFWITMDVASTVTNNHTVTCNAMTTSNLTSPNTLSGSAAAGGTQTLKKQPSSTNGGAQAVCPRGTSNPLGGNTPAFGSGLWTCTAAPIGGSTSDISLSNASSGNSTATASASAVPGSYTLRWEITNSPCSAASTLTFTVNATPTATLTNPSGVTSICSGTPVTLSATTSTAGSGTIVSYQWLFNSANIGGASSSTYSASSPGDYVLIITNSNGCIDTSTTYTLGGNTSPTASISLSLSSAVCYGDTIILDASLSTAGSGSITAYQWYNDSVLISGATLPTYVATTSGDYTVKVTNSGNCANTLSYPIEVLVKSDKQTMSTNPLPTATISAAAAAVCKDAASPKILFTAANGTAPYTFTYTVNGGANQTVTTVSGDTVTASVPTGTVGDFKYYLLNVQDASSTTCSQAYTDSSSTTVQAPPTAIANLDRLFVCDGSAQLSADSISPAIGTTITWRKSSGSGSIADSTTTPASVTGLNAGTSVYNLLGTNNVCVNSSMGSVSINMPTVSSTALASTASCGYCVMQDGNTRSFYNESGELIAQILDDVDLSSSLSQTEICMQINSSVQTIIDDRGKVQPYLQRQWSIHPANGTRARVTLYFTNAELLALQSRANTTEYQFSGYSSLSVTKYPGGSNGSFTAAGSPDARYVAASFSAYNSNHKAEFVVDTFSTFYINPNTFNYSVLPVELTSFTGWNEGAINQLQWSTASEKNTHKFEIERSTDGINWGYIGEQASAGNSTQLLSYNFSDNAPVVGNNYYRLKMVDLDASFTYSNTINIKLNDVLKDNIVNLYPNPTTGLLNVELQSTVACNATFSVYDMLGSVITEESRLLERGLNTVKMNFRSLAKGVYILHFKDAKGMVHTTRFSKD